MDLRLFARVLWRFRLIVAVGFVVAVVLAALSLVSVGPSGVKYRQTELWSSSTRLGVTQKGFPWGRLFALDPGAGPSTPNSGIPVADPNRFNTLAVLYAELASSDPIRRLMLKDGPVLGKIIATPVVVGENRIMLPLVDVRAIATTPEGAVQLALRTATALQTYVGAQQRSNKVPDADRVVLERVVSPTPPEVFQPRSKTMAIVVFLAVMLATSAFAFLLENLRPRPRELGTATDASFEPARRRTA